MSHKINCANDTAVCINLSDTYCPKQRESMKRLIPLEVLRKCKPMMPAGHKAPKGTVCLRRSSPGAHRQRLSAELLAVEMNAHSFFTAKIASAVR